MCLISQLRDAKCCKTPRFEARRSMDDSESPSSATAEVIMH